MTSAPARPRVLSIAGTDPTGGAGIQADLKSFAAHGAYGMAVVTALVAQNTQGVRSTHVPGAGFLREQLDAVSDDVVVDAVKVGMVATAANADVITAWLGAVRVPVVVVDPVMVATSGHSLLDDDARAALVRLLGRAHLVTPNLAELASLVDEPVALRWADAIAQGVRLEQEVGAAVLVKGGHLGGHSSPDALVTRTGVVEIEGDRVHTPNTHGTGCSLSSAVAALQPRLGSWEHSVRTAKVWLTGALRAADGLAVGRGRGPVDHGAAAEVVAQVP
jgi:hydroxymethylpyrimidine kinase/phosphomethylpyrimidine kinase